MPSNHSSKSTFPREVQVLRIPANGSKPEIFTVHTITDDKTDCESIDARTIGLEDELGHTPDLELFHRSEMIDLDYLSLFNRDPSSPGSAGSQRSIGTQLYYIYKCVTETPAKLPENKRLKKFKKGRNYGDAFVFKVRYVDDFHGESKAVFGSMHGFLRSFEREGGAVQTLKAMAKW